MQANVEVCKQKPMGLKRVYTPDLLLNKRYHAFKLILASKHTFIIEQRTIIFVVMNWAAKGGNDIVGETSIAVLNDIKLI